MATFPQAAKETPGTRTQAEAPRILAADDQPHILDAIELLLQPEGYRVERRNLRAKYGIGLPAKPTMRCSSTSITPATRLPAPRVWSCLPSSLLMTAACASSS